MNTKLNIVALIAIMAFVLPAFASAGTVALEGTIKSANAVMYNQAAFVLTTSGSNHFLSNVPISVKVGLVGKDIRVIGKKRAIGIFVDRIESENGRLLYSWDAEHWDGNGGGGFKKYPRGWVPVVGYY
jgi:hypothetical protein